MAPLVLLDFDLARHDGPVRDPRQVPPPTGVQVARHPRTPGAGADPRLAAPELTIRPARDSDARALQRLAELDSQQVPTGPLLLAFVAGEPWAAVQVSGDAAIADPFRPTVDVVEILRTRAAQVRGRSRRPLRTYRFASPPLALIRRRFRRPPGARQALGRQ
jgi:hypothetical protein